MASWLEYSFLGNLCVFHMFIYVICHTIRWIFGLPQKRELRSYHAYDDVENLNKERRHQYIEGVFPILMLFGFLSLEHPVGNLMDLPDILVGDIQTVTGKVLEDTFKPNGKQGVIKIISDEDQKQYTFKYDDNMHICKDAVVEIKYTKVSKLFYISKINGRSLKLKMSSFRFSAVCCMILLAVFVPVWWVCVFRVKPFLRADFDDVAHRIYVYYDKLILGLMGLHSFMANGILILLLALFGYYNTKWDWVWYILVVVYYSGVIVLSVLENKDFIIFKDRFAYCAFRKKVEGRLDEIISVEEVPKGLLLKTEHDSMMIFCTATDKKEKLLEKLNTETKKLQTD